LAENPCSGLESIAFNIAEIKYNLYLDSIKNAFDNLYYSRCMSSGKLESFTVKATLSEYHYTLYYYDQAGNLVKTVPPAGVNKMTDPAFLNNVKNARLTNGSPVRPAHTLATEYRYNTLNSVVAQKTPDAGKSNFWYDRLGRLVASSNAKQAPENDYSYTLYDELGRIKEVGQLKNSAPLSSGISRNAEDKDIIGSLAWWLSNKPAVQITKTFYDKSYIDGNATLCPEYLCQQNLRNRVSYTAYYDSGVPGYAESHTAATYYSYDIAGNVHTLLQDYGNSLDNPNAMNTTGNRFKKIAYNYDLISGKVNQVAYQPGEPDAFYHRYSYDAENRLTDVEVSLNNIIWERMARYSYYKHGPLSTSIYGQQQIQSVTNVYTLQGWIKGIVPGDDPNSLIAKQAFNYGLGYFTNDYTPIGSISDPFVSLNKGNDLYNGNIKAMLVNIPKVGEPVLHSYKYDQLNRIKEVNNYNNYSSSNNTWSATNAHKETLSFDANGNIQTALLNGSAGNLPYENFTYNYDAVKKNRLLSIHNSVNSTTSNYNYDEIGNITKDELEGNKDMVWSIYGKLLMAKKISTGLKITYSYDASGNRISKQVGNSYEEWTVRDAAGNVMATYVKDPAINNGRLTTQGYEMYGSSAIGTWEKRRDVENTDADNNENAFIRGEQKIRFSNHLGNTMLVLSDIKRQIQSPEDPSQIIGYTPEVINATDYSAYGENLIGREFSSEGIKFGFNGKLNDNDLGYQDYGMRLSSVKKRGFLSVDPLTKKYSFYSPYQFSGNSPIKFVDLDGGEPTAPKEELINIRLVNGLDKGNIIEGTFDPNDRLHRISVEKLYDPIKQQAFFVHQDNNGNYYYWDSPYDNLRIERKADGSSVANGSWQPFLTYEQTQQRIKAAAADVILGVFGGSIAAIIAAPVITASAPIITSAATTYSTGALTASLGSRLISAGANTTFQYIQNAPSYGWLGENIKNINVTSVGLSFINPSAIATNAVGGNFGKWTGKEKFREALGGNQFNFKAAAFGTVVDFTGGKLGQGLELKAGVYGGMNNLQSQAIGDVLSGAASTPANTIVDESTRQSNQ